MDVEIVVPDLPESVADAVVALWHKEAGYTVVQDECLVELETDKVVLEVPAPTTGILQQICQPKGRCVSRQQVLGIVRPVAHAAVDPVSSSPQQQPQSSKKLSVPSVSMEEPLTPAVRRLLAEHHLDPGQLTGSGPHGRITPHDIECHLAQQAAPTEPAAASTLEPSPLKPQQIAVTTTVRRVPMSRLRQRIAERLVAAKQNTAMLTTFNEVNLQPVLTLRKTYGEAFQKRYGIKLGLMSFFVQAVVAALEQFPDLGACLEGDEILYYPTRDISIAVATPRGLVTPVLRDCGALSLAAIELQIKALATKGKEGKLSLDELIGGHFTITNGGIFGSLLSTPILNTPQCAILGMHAIQERPMAVAGRVEILPMMNLALSYDHRLIDGQTSVSFLVAIKNMLEEPMRLWLEV